jgi:hypothetical protein
MRLAYADPPYLGCCGKFYEHFHNDNGPSPWDGKCWDDVATHEALIRHLDSEYDGWAYSMTSQSLRQIIPVVDGVEFRVAAWAKPFAAFKRNVRIAYTWEPVLFSPGRDSSKLGAPVGRDHIAKPITMKKGFTGTKPPDVCRWVLDLLGYVEGDQVTDLFPGLGVMSEVLTNAPEEAS